MDEVTAQALISKYFPDLIINTIRKIGEGTGNKAYEVNTNLIFRFPKRLESQLQLEQEIVLQEILKNYTTLPIPKFTFIPPDHSFVGYQKVPGTPLIDMGSQFTDWSIFSKQIGQFISKLHTIPVAELNKLKLKTENKSFEEWQSHSFPFYEKTKNLIAEHFYPNIEAFFNSKPNNTSDNLVLCHNDLGIEHILVDDNKVSGVIDWGGVALTDPAADFARIYRDVGEKILDEVLAEYSVPNIDNDALRESAIFYGKCLVFEDLFCGLREDIYLKKALLALEWMF